MDKLFVEIGPEIGTLVDNKQKAYGDSFGKVPRLLAVFLEDYISLDGANYVLPIELLPHLALQIRILDKQNRVFSNPKKDMMAESPYRDIVGYGLLGVGKFKDD